MEDVVFSWSTVLFTCSCKNVSAAAAPAHFLLISGMTEVDETCLAGFAAGVWLESCEKAVAGMRGEEMELGDRWEPGARGIEDMP